MKEVVGYTFYTFHSWFCEQVSIIKNDSKTGKSFFDEQGSYSHQVLDFAKISIQDGVFITPIPYGLASAYMNKPGFTDIQLYLWLSSKGVTYKELVYKRIFKGLSQQTRSTDGSIFSNVIRGSSFLGEFPR
jgi:hypothetical protein